VTQALAGAVACFSVLPAPVGPGGAMPAFRDAYSIDELYDVATFIVERLPPSRR